MKIRFLLNSILLVITVLLVSTGCRKDIEGPRLRVSPNSTEFTRQAGQLMEFGIDASADDGLKSLRITKKEDNQITYTVLDTVLSGSNANFTYPFLVPAQGVSKVNFVFILEDMEGRVVKTPRYVVVTGSAFLQEKAGLQLYSIHAGDADRAFNITTEDLFQISIDTDSLTIDVMEYDADDDGILSKSWTSASGLQFVQANSNTYNYAQATFNSAKSSYDEGSKQDVVSGISTDDIIITRYSTDPERYAVIDIIEIHDEEGSENDYYRFNLKK